MFTIRSLSDAFIALIAQLFNVSPEDVVASGATITILDPSSHHSGDLTTNAAMTMARLLKKPPRALAEEIVQALATSTNATATIAGPGFINITLSPKTWSTIANQIATHPADYFKAEIAQHKSSYLIEYVSANPTGPLHLGHGRNAIIGNVLASALKFAGNEVSTEFYINDAGVQMQKLGASLKARCLELSGIPAEIPEEGYHGQYLIEIAQQLLADHDNMMPEKELPFFTHYAQEKLIAQQKNELSAYGVVFDNWFSELTLHKDGSIDKALAELKQRGFLYENDNALWFKSTDFGDDKDRVIRKQDGSLTYIAPDIAYHVNKFSRGFTTLIDIVGQDHHGYVLRLKGTLAALGYDANNLEVILYQLVSLKQGDTPLKMSKRSGNFIGLQEVIDTVGIDAARFFFLHKKADSHLELDIDVALKQTQENPVFYLQYAYVRTISISAKAAELNITATANATIFTQEEVVLLKKTLGLATALNAVTKQYATHVLAQYALELAQVFHTFYTNNKVIDIAQPETSSRRLLLVHVVNKTLGLTIDLLGLTRRESM